MLGAFTALPSAETDAVGGAWHPACTDVGEMPRNHFQSERSEPLPVVAPERGVAGALEHVYEAGQALLLRRLELLMEEARGLVSSALMGGAGLLLALGGWALVIAGALQALEPGTPRFVGATAIGLAHLVTGGVIAYRARARGGSR